jgi:hypothetical protein
MISVEKNNEALSRIEFHQQLKSLLEKNLPEEDVSAIKKILSDYFIKKADDEMDKLAAERGWTQETYDNWLNEKS